MLNRQSVSGFCGVVSCVVVLGLAPGCTSSASREDEQLAAEQEILRAISESGGMVTTTESVFRNERFDYLPEFLRREHRTTAYEVELSESQITEENLNRLSKLAHLKRLVLKTSKLDERVARSLKELRRLECLTIQGTKESDEAIVDLTASLPNTLIIR